MLCVQSAARPLFFDCGCVCCVAAETIVKIWNPFTGELVRNLSGHTGGLSDIAWSSDGVYLASASDDTTIRIWEVDTVCMNSFVLLFRPLTSPRKGLTAKHLKGHTKWVFCVNYNKASNLLVSGGCEGDVRIWNPARGCPFPQFLCDFSLISRLLGKCMKTLHGHLDYVTAVHFNREATLIVSCALDGLMYTTLSRFRIFFRFDSHRSVDGYGIRLMGNASRRSRRAPTLCGPCPGAILTVSYSCITGSTSSFRPTQSIFCRPRTIALSGYGITRLRAA